MGVKNSRTPVGVPRWTLGDRLRKARTSAGVERDEVAADIGMTARTISNYENDHTQTPKLVVRYYSIKFGVPRIWIETGTEPPDGGDDDPSTSWYGDRPRLLCLWRVA